MAYSSLDSPDLHGKALISSYELLGAPYVFLATPTYMQQLPPFPLSQKGHNTLTPILNVDFPPIFFFQI